MPLRRLWTLVTIQGQWRLNHISQPLAPFQSTSLQWLNSMPFNTSPLLVHADATALVGHAALANVFASQSRVSKKVDFDSADNSVIKDIGCEDSWNGLGYLSASHYCWLFFLYIELLGRRMQLAFILASIWLRWECGLSALPCIATLFRYTTEGCAFIASSLRRLDHQRCFDMSRMFTQLWGLMHWLDFGSRNRRRIRWYQPPRNECDLDYFI